MIKKEKVPGTGQMDHMFTLHLGIGIPENQIIRLILLKKKRTVYTYIEIMTTSGTIQHVTLRRPTISAKFLPFDD